MRIEELRVEEPIYHKVLGALFLLLLILLVDTSCTLLEG